MSLIDFMDWLFNEDNWYYTYADKEDSLVVKFTMPGVPKENISLVRYDDMIILKTTEPKKSAKFSLTPQGYTFGKAEAVYKDGILTITIPKIGSKGEKIEIN